MTNEELGIVFNKIKRDFFPHWDQSGAWKALIGISHTGDFDANIFRGHCESQLKTIWINPNFDPSISDELDVLIIHEICHAVASPYHGVGFQNRLSRAWLKAQSLHLDHHADLIQAELDMFHKPKQVSAREIRDFVEDAVFDQPDATFDQVIRIAAETYALKPDALVEKYPSVKAAFEKAKKDIQDM
jgi:hypothetical protein